MRNSQYDTSNQNGSSINPQATRTTMQRGTISQSNPILKPYTIYNNPTNELIPMTYINIDPASLRSDFNSRSLAESRIISERPSLIQYTQSEIVQNSNNYIFPSNDGLKYNQILKQSINPIESNNSYGYNRLTSTNPVNYQSVVINNSNVSSNYPPNEIKNDVSKIVNLRESLLPNAKNIPISETPIGYQNIPVTMDLYKNQNLSYTQDNNIHKQIIIQDPNPFNNRVKESTNPSQYNASNSHINNPVGMINPSNTSSISVQHHYPTAIPYTLTNTNLPANDSNPNKSEIINYQFDSNIVKREKNNPKKLIRQLGINRVQNISVKKNSLRPTSPQINTNKNINDAKFSSPTSISSFSNDNPHECSFGPIDNNESRMPKIKIEKIVIRTDKKPSQSIKSINKPEVRFSDHVTIMENKESEGNLVKYKLFQNPKADQVLKASNIPLREGDYQHPITVINLNNIKIDETARINQPNNIRPREFNSNEIDFNQDEYESKFIPKRNYSSVTASSSNFAIKSILFNFSRYYKVHTKQHSFDI